MSPLTSLAFKGAEWFRSQMSKQTLDPNNSQVESIANFVCENDFICPWGRDALAKGQIALGSYVEGADPRARIQSILPSLHELGSRKVAAVLWTRSSVETHTEAFKQSWVFYVDLQCACRSLALGRHLHVVEREQVERMAQRFITNRDWYEYIATGSPTLFYQPLHLISMNNLYSPSHPLYAPVFVHSVTRQSDLLRIRVGTQATAPKRRRWRAFVANFLNRGAAPYIKGLPYFLPDDPTMSLRPSCPLAPRSAAREANPPGT
jgi:hypothetical protein